MENKEDTNKEEAIDVNQDDYEYVKRFKELFYEQFEIIPCESYSKIGV